MGGVGCVEWVDSTGSRDPACHLAGPCYWIGQLELSREPCFAAVHCKVSPSTGLKRKASQQHISAARGRCSPRAFNRHLSSETSLGPTAHRLNSRMAPL